MQAYKYAHFYNNTKHKPNLHCHETFVHSQGRQEKQPKQLLQNKLFKAREMSLNNALLPMGFQIQIIWSECTIKKKICPTIQGIVAYPRKNTYWPVKLSMFLVLCKSTSWGSIATASKYSENVHITWPPIHSKNLIRINKWNIVTQVIKIPAFLKKMKNEKCETKLQTDLLEGEIFINKKSQK